MPQVDHTIAESRVFLNSGSPVRVEQIQKHGEVLLHEHRFYEIVLVTGGKAEHITLDGTEQIRAGSAFIIAPGQAHGYQACSKFAIINIYYLAEWFLADIQALRSIGFLVPLFFRANLYNHPVSRQILHIQLSPSERERCLAELEEIRQQDFGKPRLPLLYLEACFLKFLIILGQAASRGKGVSEPQTFRREVQKGIEEIENLVSARQAFTVAGVARLVGLSPDHFTRLFRQGTGMSPMDYYQRHRIHNVCRRLLDSKSSVTEIAYEFGYADCTHLDRYFKRFIHATPSVYRARATARHILR